MTWVRSCSLLRIMPGFVPGNQALERTTWTILLTLEAWVQRGFILEKSQKPLCIVDVKITLSSHCTVCDEQRDSYGHFQQFCKLQTYLSFSSVQSLSRVRLFATPWTTARQASLSITNSPSLLKLMSVEPVMPSHPLSSPSPPALYLSQHHGLFKWVSSSHQLDKLLEFQLQHWSFQWTPRTDLL